MLRNKEVILDERPDLTVLNAANDVVQLSLFGVIFSAIKQTLESNARYFVLPLALAGDAMRACFALADWFNAKNKNLRKTSKLLLELAKLVIVGTAIIGSLAGCVAIAAVTPFIFIAAIGSNTLYHAGLSIFHGLKWVFTKSKAEAAYHKKHFLNNLLGAVTGIAVTTAIAVLLAFKPDLGILNLVIGTVATVMTGITAIVAGLSGYGFYKQRKMQMAVTPVSHHDLKRDVSVTIHTSNNLVNAVLTAKNEHALMDKRMEESKEELLPKPIVAAKKIKLFHEDLIADMRSHNADDRKLYVNHVIQEKIDNLVAEQGSLNIFYPDKQKIKISALKMLRHLVNDGIVCTAENTTIESIDGLLDYLKQKNINGTVMSSILRDVGEVQKIFLLTDAYMVDAPARKMSPSAA
jgi:hypothetical protein